jgi:hypothetical protein
MSGNIGTPLWALNLLPHWDCQREAECISISRTNGVGALQISAYTKETAVTTDDLREFADPGLTGLVSFASVRLGQFSGIAHEYTADGMFHRRWYVSNQNVMLFATYVCEVGEEFGEPADVDAMLATLTSTNAI